MNTKVWTDGLEYRVFTMYNGWGAWHTKDGLNPGGDYSDAVGSAYAEAAGWDTTPENAGAEYSMSMTQTKENGEPADSGVCMIHCEDGLKLLEYRLKA